MSFLELLKKRVVFIDGAMGTNIIERFPDRFPAGSDSTQIIESLNILSPEVVAETHSAFLEAGCDVIETNSFNANKISLRDTPLQGRVAELAGAATRIARETVKKYSTKKHPRFISGSIGPLDRLPTLGQITFDEMESAYIEQIAALVEGGVDLLQIETCQDPLQAKVALIAAREVMTSLKREVPIIVTATVDASGKTLLGTDIETFLTTVEPYMPAAVGLNCSTGPAEMEETVRNLCDISPFPVAVLPNAGLPELNENGMRYSLTPSELADWLERFVHEFGVAIVGGCCGTTPEHLAEVIRRLDKSAPKKRKVLYRPKIASLFVSKTLDQTPKPLLIGERTNATGSKEFREALKIGNYDGAIAVARKQEEKGVHLLDVSVALAGRDEIKDIVSVTSKLIRQVETPLMLDSTNPDAIRAALKVVSGRPIINSINLEDGGEKAMKVLALAKKYGACIVALTIDEEGMATTAKRKLSVAGRLIEFIKKQGLREEDILIDPLTFTLSDPKASAANAGSETIQGIKLIKKKYPHVRTLLGVSNISYGLPLKVRELINSVFFFETVQAGLDAAIVNVSQIVPHNRIPQEMVKLVHDVIHGDMSQQQPMTVLMQHVGRGGDAIMPPSEHVKAVATTAAERLRQSVIDGARSDLEEIIAEVVKTVPPKDVINRILLPAMDEVGHLFGDSELPLPFVLQSAEVMRNAVEILKPNIDQNATGQRGKLLLATVRGDVHDIGKNLVEIIVTNNGYEVINLGVKQSVDRIIQAAIEHNVDAIGLSGLLVSSTQVMKEDLEEMARRGIKIPVICGGAALTRNFVDESLQRIYEGDVYYAKDAFDGLKIMDVIVKK